MGDGFRGGFRGSRIGNSALGSRRGWVGVTTQGLQVPEDDVDRDGIAGLDGFEERDFEEDAFGRSVAEPPFIVDEDFHDTTDRRGIGEGGLVGEGSGFGFGQIDEVHLSRSKVVEEKGAEVAKELGEEAGEILSVAGEFFDEA